MVPPLVELALDYYRDPLSYPHLTDGCQALPLGLEGMLVGFCRALSPARIDVTAALLATDPGELREAGRVLLRRVLLQVEADHYRCLDLAPDASQETIRTHYFLLMGLFHPDRVEASNDLDLSAASRLNRAYRTLRDPVARAEYDRSLPVGGVRRAVDARAFLKRSPLGLVGIDSLRPQAAVSGRPRRAGRVLWFAGVAVTAALGVLLWPQPPQLRMTQPGAAPATRLPSYLRDARLLPASGPTAAKPVPLSSPRPPAQGP